MPPAALSFSGCWSLMARYSHYGLVLMLGPLLVLGGIGCLLAWLQTHWRPAIYGFGIILLWWQLSLGNGALMWLMRVRGAPRQPALRALLPQPDLWPVAAWMLTIGFVALVPEMLINIDDANLSPVLITGTVLTAIGALWLSIRLMLVPVLVCWHCKGWQSWATSWSMTAGPHQWRLAGLLLAGTLPCELAAAGIQYMSVRPHHISILDLFILPFIQMLLMVIVTLWPLSVAANFCLYPPKPPTSKK